MKIGIVLDNKISKWALQRFEPLKETCDITVFVGERNDYDVSAIGLKKKFLSKKEEISLALRDPVTAFNRFVKAPYKKMDFYYFSLRKHLKGFDAVYSCDLMRSAYSLASLKEMLGFKLFLFWWENVPYRAALDDKSSFQKKSIMKNVDYFFPFTKHAKENLLMEGVREDKIKVVYPGLDMQRFSPGEKPGSLSAKNRIPEGSFVILYVGKLVSWKGVHNLVYAARILKMKGIKNFVFAVAGRGAQKNNMLKLIAETGTEENFRFLDFISYDEMPEVYRMADLFVLPSYPTMTWQEQFGMVIVEAMASGIPVISTNTGTIPEVMGDAGIIIPPGDYNALAGSIIKLMNDEPLRKELSGKGRERALELFSSNKKSEELNAALKEIL
ncbi:MAG: glycosyltransferase family 4 protein [Nitrospirae bacterium]|nr:glycosyltransferase family 4 protein [Nitrospirota bacterium]